MNSVATGFGADIQDRISDAGGFAKEDLIFAHESEGERIDQRIQRVSIVE